ncbi:MAG: hypothetical protein M5U01_17050 [Ardenticatenaceae bacterium]|nr:hypothetical protein [Ardenticatenaceae bacterium]
MKRSLCLFMLAAMLMVLTTTIALAQQPDYDAVKAKFAGTTLADWPDYVKAEPFCIDASLIGQPQLGAMGFHAGNMALFDLEVNALEPEFLLLDGDDNVVGVEYMVVSKEQGRPELLGQPFEESDPHPPAVPQPHYDLHVWFVGDPPVRFAPFNPAVTCPAGTMPPMEMPTTGGEGTNRPLVSGLLALVGVLAILAGLKQRHRVA